MISASETGATPLFGQLSHEKICECDVARDLYCNITKVCSIGPRYYSLKGTAIKYQFLYHSVFSSPVAVNSIFRGSHPLLQLIISFLYLHASSLQ